MSRLRINVGVLALILIGSLGSVTSLRAENPYINIPEMQRLSREARDLWWNSLTPHQQQIVHAVTLEEEGFQRYTGKPYIPVNRNNLFLLMRRVGAYPQDESFVLQRMQVHANAGEAIDRVDRFLDRARRNPNWYLPPNMQ